MNFGFLFINPEHFPVFFRLRDLLFMHVISDVNAGRRRENPAPVRDREVLVSPAPGQGATGRATMLTARSPRLRGGRNNGVFQWRLHKLKSFIPYSQTRENLRIQGRGQQASGLQRTHSSYPPPCRTSVSEKTGTAPPDTQGPARSAAEGRPRSALSVDCGPFPNKRPSDSSFGVCGDSVYTLGRKPLLSDCGAWSLGPLGKFLVSCNSSMFLPEFLAPKHDIKRGYRPN